MTRLISTRWGISYPNPVGRPDSADVPLDVGSLVSALETIGVQFAQGTLASRPTANKTGRFYVATDLSPHVIYYDNGSSWDQASNLSHEATHLAGGSDALPWTTIHGAGTLAARPAAASTNAGYTYFATDVNSGTLFRSDGSTWTQTAFNVGGVATTQAPGDNSTFIATTAFVVAAIAAATSFTINGKVASYQLVLTDAGKIIEMNNAGAITLTIPADATVNFPIGTAITIVQTGAGQVTIAAAAGATVNANPGLKLSGQYASATIYKRAANLWLAAGNLTP